MANIKEIYTKMNELMEYSLILVQLLYYIIRIVEECNKDEE
jgi:hypothetical protein